MGNIRAKPKAKSEHDIAKFLLGDSRPSADSSELLAAIMDELGGVRELGRIFARMLRDTDTSPQTKQRLVETIQRLIIMNTQHDLAKAIEPSEMTDGDLERVAMRLLGKVQNGQSTGTGTQEGPS